MYYTVPMEMARRKRNTQGDRHAHSVFQKAVASQVLEDRHKATSLLAQRGVLVVDSQADKLSAERVNKYLDVKERMML